MQLVHAGPGTGKSRLLSTIAVAAVEQGLVVGMVAPSRATAFVLVERTRELLGSRVVSSLDEGLPGAIKGAAVLVSTVDSAWRFEAAAVDAVLADESSMAQVVQLLPVLRHNPSARRLMLVGDPCQKAPTHSIRPHIRDVASWYGLHSSVARWVCAMWHERAQRGGGRVGRAGSIGHASQRCQDGHDNMLVRSSSQLR